MRSIEGRSITVAGMLGVILTLGPLVAALGRGVSAQDSRESQSEASIDKASLKGAHPLTGLMGTLKSELKPELRGKHPRVYVTAEELKDLQVKATTSHKEIWRQALAKMYVLNVTPPPPPAEARRAQNDVGVGIAEAAFAYKIEGDKKYLEAAKRYMDAAVSYDTWGYSFNRPNTDLAAGHLLYGLGWGYDLLYNDLSPTERSLYREKLVKQARLMYDYFKPKPGKKYSYSQNHTFIPITGLAVTAYALYDETPEAAEWSSLSRAIYERVLETYSADGYYYEGFEYWIFATPWLFHYMDATAHATGEDLYDRPGFRQMHKYVAHSMLPTGQYIFDFGDVFEGPLTRAGKGDEYPRTHPQGHFQTNFNLLYRLASRFKDGEAAGVAEWLKGLGQVNAEDFWSLMWYDPAVKVVPIDKQERWHYFPDHEVVYWRSDWSKNATAFAFKCGPPEGHETSKLLEKFPEWRLSAGHAHPDANSFIVFSRGQYLTGDSGYAGVPLTEHHNTLLFDGKGQGKEGAGHDAFDGVSYNYLNGIRIVEAKLGAGSVRVVGDATAAYEPGVGLRQFTRTFEFSPEKGFTVSDEVVLKKASIVTELIHADEAIEKIGDRRFIFGDAGVKLNLNIESPANVVTAVEQNALIAPGRPGSVDKGERQVRGKKLSISTVEAVESAKFKVEFQVR
jgi:hypothetical protein